MNHWSQGYVTQADYVANYVHELNPVRTRLLLPLAGYATPGPIRHACELGFGLGLGTVIHAASSGATWWGNDFSPSQTLFARQLAESAGIDLRISDESFQEFCRRSDLPEFDFVALHGVWSWISVANRSEIVDFLRRKLRVGGVVYMSANTLPGCAQMVPVRKLMRLHMERMVRPGDGTLANARSAQAFAEQLLRDNPQMAAVYPLAARAVDAMQHHGPQYISHEYLNLDWAPMPYADIAEQLDSAKLALACSALPSQHFDRHFLTAEQQQGLAAIPDPVMRESLRDFAINRGFRKDYWVRGALRPAPAFSRETLLAGRVVLARAAAQASLAIPESALETQLPEALVLPLLAELAAHRPRSLGDLATALGRQGMAEAEVLRAALCLVANHTLDAAQDEVAIAAALPRVLALNRVIIDRARHSGEIQWLACASTGGALPVAQFHLQMLAARAQGHDGPERWARYLWTLLQARGQALARHGQPLVGDKDNLDYLGALARGFASTDLPMLQALGCVD